MEKDKREASEQADIFSGNEEEWLELEREVRLAMPPYVVSSPLPEDTDRLLSSLRPSFYRLAEKKHAAEQHADAFAWLASEQHKDPRMSSLVKLQLNLYSRWYWIASFALFAMLISAVSMSGTVTDLIRGAFSYAVPLFMLAGWLYAVRPQDEGMRLVEAVTPYPPALIWMTRTVIVLACNLLLGIAGSVIVYASLNELLFFPFLLSWMAPTVFVCGMLTYVTFRRGWQAGLAASVIGWAAWYGVSEAMLYLSAQPMFDYQALADCLVLSAGAMLLLVAWRRSLACAYAADKKVHPA
ncbi:hypothetical protein [Paenibacillus apiarius]|uniref:Uncharacterized protein n=1 Tax=Paenibacillus apiarius TaxID=46240 RepID=A0ABT4DTX1_9BACL|nr:hypothetical protein [Paenibacillus apiarius]MCY9515841.1 hypothetical protein [Paenibacillus apiarius]MCY9520751.1 hypothetical protein [Paenibacillus apiarius]MCY9553455.1 hypothetical protein [Paenibacillus apiarius]MCY9558021.1 hypothetical protein [Paenibacillus apiarius]MCY9685876.1 hypothetical protein [Paenibacillus apiarius]